MKSISTSLIRKIILFMSGLLLINVILFGTTWYYSFSIIEKNTNDEIEHLLSIYTSALEHTLNSNDMNLLTIAQEQSALEELSSEDEAKRYYASMHLVDLISRLRSNNEGVDMLLATGNWENSVSDASARMKLVQRDEVIDFMNQKREERKVGESLPTGTKGWILQKSGESLYLMRTYDTLDYSVSAWIKIDSLLQEIRKLEENSERHLFIADQDGNCIGSVIAGEEDLFETWKEKGKKWSSFFGESGLKIICVREKPNIFGTFPLIQGILLLSISGMLAVLLFYLRYIRKEIFNPIRGLIKAISFIQAGNYQYRVANNCTNAEFIALNDAFNSMMDTIVELKIAEYEKQLRLQETELKYFQMQIRPHFFLNAISTIHSMSFKNRNEDIRAFIQVLSQNIRYMFKAGLHTVALEEELTHLEHYFAMQELLYPGCVFYYIEHNEQVKTWKIPQMILHTFIENKYKHVVKVGRLLSIYISTLKEQWQCEDVLKIIIEDDGIPFPENVIRQIEYETNEDGSGVGLHNVEKTLEIMYGRKGLLLIENPNGGGSKITLTIPKYTVL